MYLSITLPSSLYPKKRDSQLFEIANLCSEYNIVQTIAQVIKLFILSGDLKEHVNRSDVLIYKGKLEILMTE